MKPNDQPATFPAPGEVRLVRLLPGPIERVWDFLTAPDKRARWLSGGILEPRAGGNIEFNMHHKNLVPDETPPDERKHVHDPGVTFDGVVLKCEPKRLLVHTFGGPDSEVTFELTPQGRQNPEGIRRTRIHRMPRRRFERPRHAHHVPRPGPGQAQRNGRLLLHRLPIAQTPRPRKQAGHGRRAAARDVQREERPFDFKRMAYGGFKAMVEL